MEKRINKVTLSIQIDELTEPILLELMAVIQENDGPVDLDINLISKENCANLNFTTRKKVNLNKTLIDFFNNNNSFKYSIN